MGCGSRSFALQPPGASPAIHFDLLIPHKSSLVTPRARRLALGLEAHDAPFPTASDASHAAACGETGFAHRRPTHRRADAAGPFLRRAEPAPALDRRPDRGRALGNLPRPAAQPIADAPASASFLSWHVTAEDGNPMLSVRLDVHAGVVHVTRGILCYVWEAYDAGDNVIQSREVQRVDHRVGRLRGTGPLARHCGAARRVGVPDLASDRRHQQAAAALRRSAAAGVYVRTAVLLLPAVGGGCRCAGAIVARAVG